MFKVNNKSIRTRQDLLLKILLSTLNKQMFAGNNLFLPSGIIAFLSRTFSRTDKNIFGNQSKRNIHINQK